MTQRFIYASIFLGTFTAYVLAAILLGTLTALPEKGDGQDYDAIAFNLWHQRGFGFDWDDPEWRQPYKTDPQYKEILDRHSGFELTAYRPPAMPYLLAFVYSIAGRTFAAWRILNCAIMAAAVTMAAAIAARFAGTAASFLTAALSVLSPQLIASSQRFLTEALAAFLVTLLAWTWLNHHRKEKAWWHAAKLGVILGLLVATRSIFLLWLPLVLLVPETKLDLRRCWRPKAICLLVFLAVIGPWWLRNILVTREFMPFGTEGAINLPAAFGPRAMKFQGVWAPNHEDGEQELTAQNLDRLNFEVRLAKFRSALTIQWMREHPLDVVYLMLLHVWQELRPHGRFFYDWLLVLGGIAAIFFRKSPGIGVPVLFVGMNILSIALTWSVEGRFMVPVQLLLIALTSAMAAELARHAFLRYRRTANI